MYFVMYNSIVQAKVPKIIVLLRVHVRENRVFFSSKILKIRFDNNRHRQTGSKWHNDFP